MSSSVVDPNQCVATSRLFGIFTESSEHWSTLCVAYIIFLGWGILVQKATIDLHPTEILISKYSFFFLLQSLWRSEGVRMCAMKAYGGIEV